ncbi:MAG: hypothetical protein Unbinned3891contig1000_55 [Prokaryotic dsDNA virus sp.]|nr:MAG: hypothetical protein Unbinned3891contig1000_55 [Prokaryotic dsDNA virus sp.]
MQVGRIPLRDVPFQEVNLKGFASWLHFGVDADESLCLWGMMYAYPEAEERTSWSMGVFILRDGMMIPEGLYASGHKTSFLYKGQMIHIFSQT